VYIPEERRGLYSNENEALRFCKGRIINDEDPYSKVAHEVKSNILADMKFVNFDEGA